MTKPLPDGERKKAKRLFEIGEPATLEGLRRGTRTSEGGCWVWQRSGRGDGERYGVITVLGERWSVHRLAWVLANGPVPDGLTVDHKCFVTRCINPEHLRLLTHSENSSQRRAKTHCKHGHEFSTENTRLVRGTGGSVRRLCVACRRRVSRASDARRKAAA